MLIGEACWRLRSVEPAVVLELRIDPATTPEHLLLVNPSSRRLGFSCAELGFERARLRLDTSTGEPGSGVLGVERFCLESWSSVLVEPVILGARKS